MPPSTRTACFARVTAANFCFFLTFASFFLLPLHVRALGGTERTIGLVMGTSGLAGLVSVLAVGALLDRFGRRIFLLGGIASMSAAAGAFLLVDRIGPAIFALRALQGLAFAAGFNAASTLAAEFAPEGRRAAALGLFGVSTLATHALAPTLGEQLVRLGGFPALFVAASVFSAVGLAVAWPLPDDAPARIHAAVPLRATAELSTAIATVACCGVAFGAVITYVPTFVQDAALGSVATFFLSYTAAAVLTRVSAGGLGDSLGRRTVVLPALGLLALSIALLATVRSASALATAGLLFGTAQGFVYPTLNAYTIDLAEPGQLGRTQTLYNGAFNLGTTAGSMALGLVAHTFGHRVMFLVAAGMAVAALALLLLRQVAGALEDQELAARDERVVGACRLERDEPVGVARDDERRRADGLDARGAVRRRRLAETRDERVGAASGAERRVVRVHVGLAHRAGVVDRPAEPGAHAAPSRELAQQRPEHGPGEHAERERATVALGLRQPGRAEEDEAGRPLGVEDRRLGGDVPAHRVPDQHGAADARGVQVADHDARKPGRVVRRVGGLVAEAVAGQVDGVHPVACGERLQHLPPGVGRGGVPVQQHDVGALAERDGEDAEALHRDEAALGARQAKGSGRGQLRGREAGAGGEEDGGEEQAERAHAGPPTGAATALPPRRLHDWRRAGALRYSSRSSAGHGGDRCHDCAPRRGRPGPTRRQRRGAARRLLPPPDRRGRRRVPRRGGALPGRPPGPLPCLPRLLHARRPRPLQPPPHAAPGHRRSGLLPHPLRRRAGPGRGRRGAGGDAQAGADRGPGVRRRRRGDPQHRDAAPGGGAGRGGRRNRRPERPRAAPHEGGGPVRRRRRCARGPRRARRRARRAARAPRRADGGTHRRPQALGAPLQRGRRRVPARPRARGRHRARERALVRGAGRPQCAPRGAGARADQAARGRQPRAGRGLRRAEERRGPARAVGEDGRARPPGGRRGARDQ